ncbi:hypothetical protein [Devosia sp. XK-2]
MYILTRLLARLGKALSAPRTARNPDNMSLHDWADLPPHHPQCKTC